MNKGIPPQDPEKPQVPIEEGNMSNIEIRAASHNLTLVYVTSVGIQVYK